MTMNKKTLLSILSTCFITVLCAQVKIGDNPNNISPGSVLELESTSKAFTLPRMTTVQMQGIPSPLPGMMVFNTDSNCIYLYKINNVWSGIVMEAGGNQTAWPYQTSDGEIGAPGNAKGIISVPGAGLVASGPYSHAEGLNSAASGLYAWSSGFADTATQTGSIAMGYQNKSIGMYSYSSGFKNVSAGQASVAMGQENADSGWTSMAMGLRNKIASTVSYSNTLGYNNRILGGWANNAFGENNQVGLNRASTALGLSNTNHASYTTLSGISNRADSGYAYLLAGDNNRLISGSGGALLGQGNQAEGNYLGAIGKDNQVYHQSAIALGQNNIDSGYASIAAGHSNVVESNVQYSHVHGFLNRAGRNLSITNVVPGTGTFSAGISNVNSGYGSLALGVQTRSDNLYSLSANFNTIANSPAMSAFGHFNDTISANYSQSLSEQDILFTIGNGINASNRRNSFTMLRNGHTSINTTAENGPSLPRADLDIRGTGALIVPVGTTAERPVTPVTGMIRFCTDCPGGPVLQGYNGNEWVNL